MPDLPLLVKLSGKPSVRQEAAMLSLVTQAVQLSRLASPSLAQSTGTKTPLKSALPPSLLESDPCSCSPTYRTPAASPSRCPCSLPGCSSWTLPTSPGSS